MGKTLTEKILELHLVDGKLERGIDISIKIDQTLTQDYGRFRTILCL